MSDNNDYHEVMRTDSPSLINYFKEEIPVENLMESSTRSKRVESIDLIKGFAIIFIILAHISGSWLNTDWLYLYGLLFAVLDILGPSLFIFLSALSVIFSIKRKKRKVPEIIIRNKVFSRGIMIILIGLTFNISTAIMENKPIITLLWGWNILVFIGFSQIFSYYALKTSKVFRAVFGVLIIFYSSTIRNFLYVQKNTNIFFYLLHYIFTSPIPQLPLFPYISICFISTIFGEYLYEAMQKGTNDAYIGLSRIYLIWGVLMTLFGILSGLTLYNPYILPTSEYPQVGLLTIANSQNLIPSLRLPGLPEFLIRGRMPNIFYSLGVALLIISVGLYLVDIKGKKGSFSKMLIYLGKISLNLFLIHFIFVTYFFRFFSILFFFPIFFGYCTFLFFLMYIWMKYFNGVGTPEWLMIQVGRFGQKTEESVKKTSKKAFSK
ncbi:MAG: OpgC domain-containing protein [Candidatus Lokiarchaeota archaeon]